VSRVPPPAEVAGLLGAEPDSAAIARRLGRVLEFMRMLWAVDHALQSTSKWMEARLGVTGPQRLVIRMIGCFPGISAGALAALLHVHPSTLTGVLRRLTDRAAIRRSADPRDSRRALFWLTARGRRVDRLRSGTVESAITRALARASSGSRAAARGLLARVAVELVREVEGEGPRLNGAGRRGRETALPAPPSARAAGARASSPRAARR
jgi:MarR family transcriptional regulator, organic hydroperoxide resistance regulator